MSIQIQNASVFGSSGTAQRRHPDPAPLRVAAPPLTPLICDAPRQADAGAEPSQHQQHNRPLHWRLTSFRPFVIIRALTLQSCSTAPAGHAQADSADHAAEVAVTHGADAIAGFCLVDASRLVDDIAILILHFLCRHVRAFLHCGQRPCARHEVIFMPAFSLGPGSNCSHEGS